MPPTPTGPVPTGCANNGVEISGQQICGPLVGINSIGDLINKVLIYLIPIASIILFAVIVWGGFDIMFSGGEGERLKAGRSKITAGLIGFALLVFAFTISKLIAYIFGLDKNGII